MFLTRCADKNPWWCWIKFPLRTLPSRRIFSGEKYQFKDIPMEQNGLLTSLEQKSGGWVSVRFLCARWGSVFWKSILRFQTKERKALGFIWQWFLAKLLGNLTCSKPDVPWRTHACEGFPSQIKLRCFPKPNQSDGKGTMRCNSTGCSTSRLIVPAQAQGLFAEGS